MVGTFLDRATSLLGRRFIITAWAPTFVVGTLCAGVVVVLVGRQRLATAWNELDSASQVAVSAGALLLVTAAAFVVQSLPVVRLFEGYHHRWPFRQLGRALQLRRFDKLRNDARHEAADRPAWSELYRTLPRNRDWVLPTRLGNVLRAAETYSNRVYGADAVHWWPRLVQVIGDEERASLDEALMPMVALLNATALLLAATIASSAFLVTTSDNGGWLIAVYVGGLVLAWLAYRAAVTQAEVYGEAVRATMDLHRTKVLAQLRVSRPKNIAEEREIWGVLQDWLYNLNIPLRQPAGRPPGENAWQKRPFTFDDPLPAPTDGKQEAAT